MIYFSRNRLGKAVGTTLAPRSNRTSGGKTVQANWKGGGISPSIVDYLVVAGGGSGGSYPDISTWRGGGGGAGGLRSTVTATGGGGSLETALTVTPTTT